MLNSKHAAFLLTLAASQMASAQIGACRLSGGGVDYDPMVNNVPTGAVSLFAGQVGANTQSQPQPSGELLLRNLDGEIWGAFTFKGGTSSAPDGSEIDTISCDDPGWCEPGRPAPFMEMSFEGIGTFRNLRSPTGVSTSSLSASTFHWFEATIRDHGEPGNGTRDVAECPPDPRLGGANATCGCPDWYHVTIYDADQYPTVIYEAMGYIDDGNFQIHPPTGHDLK